MDTFTHLANKILKENTDLNFNSGNFQDEKSDDNDLTQRMNILLQKINNNKQGRDSTTHMKLVNEYDNLRDEALEILGLDAPVDLIDPELAQNYYNDIGHIDDSSFRNAIEFYKGGEFGRIEDNRFIPVRKENEVEDQENFLSKDQQQAIKLAQSLATDPSSSFFGKDPQKEVNKAYGDVMKKVANKIQKIKI